MDTDLKLIPFETPEAWENWLKKNSDTASEVWIQLFKKNSGIKTISYAEALDVALCYGWIDSQKGSVDELSFKQRFSPRGSKSIWSKVNTEHVERLIAEGKMKPAGLQKIEEAKKDGRWERAYDSSENTVIPEDFLKELHKNKKAEEFFRTLNKTNIYAVTWRLQTAVKPETRQKRMKAIIEKLSNGEKFH